MATIELRLSSKMNEETHRSEVLMRLFSGRLNIRAKSGVFVSPNHFEYYVNREATKRMGVEVPSKETATLSKATKKGYILRESGEIVVRSLASPDDKKYHDEAKNTIEDLKKVVLAAYEQADKESLSSNWMQTQIDMHLHPERYQDQDSKPPFFDMIADYRNNAKKKVNGRREGKKSEVWRRNFDVVVRALQRYEMFVRASKNKAFYLDVDTMDSDTIEDIESYLRNEHTLYEEYPNIFKQIPFSTDKRRGEKPQPRGNNTICAILNKLKAFFKWAKETKQTSNDPFEGYAGVVSEKYGTPYYITLEERNTIADYDLSNHPELAIQRDIFVFQCLIGCRVSDLLKLTPSHIIDGEVQYIPQKTKGETLRVVAVPLNERAKALVAKYAGQDKQGRLFPFISAQNYNEAIKRVFTECGITRMVSVVDSLTGEEVKRPINEVASSHMARRTFVGNLYKRVQDPNLISSMSGHAEGSKAFARYREIDKATKQKTVALIE